MPKSRALNLMVNISSDRKKWSGKNTKNHDRAVYGNRVPPLLILRTQIGTELVQKNSDKQK